MLQKAKEKIHVYGCGGCGRIFIETAEKEVWYVIESDPDMQFEPVGDALDGILKTMDNITLGDMSEN
jgi:DNA/RNA-binding domain of Phe-tRNA-synthetase-like protein